MVTILIAENDPVSRYMLRKILEGFGYKVLEAEDGQRALDLFHENDIRMVIIDWVTPKINGMALCNR